MTEAEAYLAQARSDFATFELLAKADREEVAECQPLHYLQMATEKLAKAAFIALGLVFDHHSHVAFSRIPYQLRRRDVARALGWESFEAFRSFLRRTAPIFRQIDELNPAVAERGGERAGPNVEYPWQGRDGHGAVSWIAPAGHEFGLLAKLQRSGDGAHCGAFIRALLDRFDSVFGR